MNGTLMRPILAGSLALFAFLGVALAPVAEARTIDVDPRACVCLRLLDDERNERDAIRPHACRRFINAHPNWLRRLYHACRDDERTRDERRPLRPDVAVRRAAID